MSGYSLTASTAVCGRLTAYRKPASYRLWPEQRILHCCVSHNQSILLADELRSKRTSSYPQYHVAKPPSEPHSRQDKFLYFVKEGQYPRHPCSLSPVTCPHRYGDFGILRHQLHHDVHRSLASLYAIRKIALNRSSHRYLKCKIRYVSYSSELTWAAAIMSSPLLS